MMTANEVWQRIKWEDICMNALMAELTPYILVGLFGLVGWYIRDNQRQHADLVSGLNSGLNNLSSTIIGLEQRLEDQIKDHSLRFGKYTMSMERRMTEVETRCAYEHGDIPDHRRQPRQHHIIDWQQSSDIGGNNA